VDKFAASIERPKTESASAFQGGTSWPGAQPLDPVGGCITAETITITITITL